jgi:subtilase family serine protease
LRGRSLRIAGAIALGLLLALPLPVFAATAGRPVPTPVSASASSPVPRALSYAYPDVPAVLDSAWTARAGYNASLVGQALGASVVTGTLSVSITFWPTNPGLFASATDGAAPISRGELASEYGLSPAAYSVAEQYFLGHGLTLLHVWPDRLSLTVQGPAADVDSAFGTQVVQGELGGRLIEYPASAPSLPAPLSEEVAAVSGLTSAESPFEIPFALDAPPAPQQGRETREIDPDALHLSGVYDLNGLYNYSGQPHYAGGIGIALILWGAGYNPSDIQTYFSTVYPSQFPAANVAPYPIDGAPAPSASAPSDPSNSSQEMTLDIEWAGTAAPGATLDAVYAPDGPPSNSYSPTDSTMEDAIGEAVSLIPGVDVMSMSFGSLDGQDPSFESALAVKFAEAGTEGITVLAASGDTGGDSGAGCSGGTAPQFPASSPDVIAVGGTAPVLGQDAFGTITGIDEEPAWSLSGGGFSLTYAAASWEEVGSARAPVLANGHRAMPDVAGPAAENIFYYNGAIAYGSGTSFATPMWAGLVGEMDAVRGKALGFITPRIYQVGASEPTGSDASGLADITSGSTCIVPNVGPGWDMATGWGTPKARALFEHLAGTYVVVNISASPAPVAPGGTLTARVAVLNQTSYRPIPDLKVAFSVTSTYSGPCAGSLAYANSTTDASGSASLSVTVPACYLGTSVAIDASVASGGYLGSNSTTVAVNLFGLAGFLALTQTYPYNYVAFALIMAAATAVGLHLGRHRHHPAAAPAPGGGAPAPASPGASTAGGGAAGYIAPPPKPPEPVGAPPEPPAPPAESAATEHPDVPGGGSA